MKVEFFRHNIDDKDIANMEKVLRSIFLTTGEVVKEFENKFSTYLNIEKVVGVTSCTSALHLSLIAAGIKTGDEVITTPLSFVATANAIEYVGAKPVFADVEKTTGLIDVNKITEKITRKTKAIIPVHLYGQMADMKAIRKIADRYGLSIIEDAAHCIEGQRDGCQPGTLGDFVCFSFYATKNITSGEGGAVGVHNKKNAILLKKLRLHGLSSNAADRYSKKYEHYDMEMLGWKHNMSDIQAALLLHQLEKIDQRRKKRDFLYRRYAEAFVGNKNIQILQTVPNSISARHLFIILVPNGKRDRVLHLLQEKMIGVAVNFRPIHLMKFYRTKYGYKNGDFPVAEDFGARAISLPLYPKLLEKEQDYIISQVNKLF